MIYNLLSSFLFLCFATAAPSTSPQVKAVKFLDNFDHPPNPNPVLPVASPVQGTAGGALYYNAFSYADHSTTNLTFKVPSYPYCIGSGITAILQQGQRSIRTMNASIPYFDPTKIFYACQVYDATGNPSIATPCTIRFTGVKYGSGAPVVEKLVYDPSLLPLGETFSSKTFGWGFAGLSKIDIDLADSELDPDLVVVDLDSFGYTAYFKI
ncbi:MAG: hypothetical protein Q9167_001457 [Letrouitia subvulpina]